MITQIKHGTPFPERMKMNLFVELILLVLLSLPISLFAQIPEQPGLPADTTGKKDSAYVPIPTIPLIGSIDRSYHRDETLPDSIITFSDYGYLGDLFATFPGVFVQNLGSPGQLHGLNIDGVGARSIAILSDGILLNDPLTGVYDMSLYPTEQIERVEMVPTSRAFLYGINSTGGAINLVTQNYNAATPISRIRYTQSAYENTYFDGFVTQDVRRNLNVTLGLQHSGYGEHLYGGRFKNDTYDAWNARFKVRYNFSNDLNIFASEIYNITHLDLYGGIDTSTDQSLRYERSLAIVRNEYSYEKISRHDVQLGLAARLLPDSNDITSFILFHSTNLREYREENIIDLFGGRSIQQDHRSQWFGGRVTQHLSLIGNSLDFGAEIQRRGVIASSVMSQHLLAYSSIWGKDELSLFSTIDLAGYARLDNNSSKTHLSYGADAAYKTVLGVEFFGGFSHSYRYPTLQELYWQDTIVSSIPPSVYNVETHNLIEAGIKLHDEHINFSLKFFRRTIDHPSMTLQPTQFYPFPQVVFDMSDANKLIIQGIDAKAGVRIGILYAEGNLQYLKMKNNDKPLSQLPAFSATGGIYYWDTLFGAHLNLKAGLRGTVLTAHDGMEYNPQAQIYVPSYYWNVKASGTSDLVILAHIGDADISLIWENLLNLHYTTVPFFPMPDRTIRFGINWRFLN